MCKTVAVADADRDILRNLDADIRASLALSRATLIALAALSPVLTVAAAAALDDEAARAERGSAPQRTLQIVRDVRDNLHRAPGEARIALALQQALVAAADALPPEAARRNRVA